VSFNNKYLSIIVEIINILFSYGGPVGYLVIIGQLIPPMFAELFGGDFIFANVSFFTSLIVLFIIFPLSILKKISFLSFTSFLSISAAIFALFAITFHGLRRIFLGQVIWKEILLFSPDWKDTFLALPILFFAFGSIVTLLPSYKEVKNRNITKMYIAALINLGVSCSMYLVCGFFGYIQFLGNTKDNILSNYENDVLISLSKVGFFFS